MLMSWFTQNKLTLFELALFPMYGALMYASKILMEVFPNVHLIAMFTVLLTVVYRKKALIPVLVFVFLTGLFSGFSLWWVPYLYLWPLLWAAALLIPQNISKKAAFFLYPSLCALHGFLYGSLYAPFQALAFGLTLPQMFAWIVAGLPWDVLHGISNFALGFLVLPLSKVIQRVEGLRS